MSSSSDTPRYGSDVDDDDVYDAEDLRLEAFGGRGIVASDASGDSNEGYPGACLSAATGVSLLKAKLKEAGRQIRRLEDERKLLREENDTLRRRDVEMMSLGTQLNHRFQSLQTQVDGIKTTIRTELLQPVSEKEYRELESMAEGDRDLVAAIKLGVYQQLGSMRASRDTAVRRCSEATVEVESLTAKNKSLQQQLIDVQATRDAEQADFRRQLGSFEQRASHVAELNGKILDLESKLKSVYVEQDQLLHAKLTASTKTNELSRTQLMLKESDSEVQRYKSLSECNEQKLDILKSEFYDLRLKYQQRVAQLEGDLRLAEERLKVMSDFELEAEAFMTNMASAIEDSGTTSAATAAVSDACGKLMCVPNSRKVHHAVTVTRKCLQLDNQLTLVRSELAKSQDRSTRLEKSLEICRAALNNTNSPFALAEDTINALTKESDQLKAQNGCLRGENGLLQAQVRELVADVDMLSKHRSELLRIRELLRQMGAPQALLLQHEQPAPAAAQGRTASSSTATSKAPVAAASSATGSPRSPRNDDVSMEAPRFVPAQVSKAQISERQATAFGIMPEMIEIC
jgi:chromosome segregation ATPase